MQFGRRHVDDLALDAKRVPWLDRTRPAQFVDAATDDAFRQRQGLHEELHRDRGGVPSAGDELLEERRPRAGLVEVERLRIELAGKTLDRSRVDDRARLRREHLPGSEILEVSLLHRILLR